MCLQDLKIGKRLSRRTVTVALGGDVVSAPLDFTRVAYCHFSPGFFNFRLNSNTTLSSASEIPRYTGVQSLNNDMFYYYREYVGGAFNFPVYVASDGGGTAVLTLYEYDAETIEATAQSY